MTVYKLKLQICGLVESFEATKFLKIKVFCFHMHNFMYVVRNHFCTELCEYLTNVHVCVSNTLKLPFCTDHFFNSILVNIYIMMIVYIYMYVHVFLSRN